MMNPTITAGMIYRGIGAAKPTEADITSHRPRSALIGLILCAVGFALWFGPMLTAKASHGHGLYATAVVKSGDPVSVTVLPASEMGGVWAKLGAILAIVAGIGQTASIIVTNLTNSRMERQAKTIEDMAKQAQEDRELYTKQASEDREFYHNRLEEKEKQAQEEREASAKRISLRDERIKALEGDLDAFKDQIGRKLKDERADTLADVRTVKDQLANELAAVRVDSAKGVIDERAISDAGEARLQGQVTANTEAIEAGKP